MRRVWTPASLAVAARSLFSTREIEAYEREILANPRATERDASKFFALYPKFLHLGAGAEVRRETVLVSAADTPRQRVDFFRRSYGRPFWDLIELKDPRKPTIVGLATLHPRLSADIERAISQALDYRDLIERDGALRLYLEDRGIRVCRPQIIVVAGRRQEEVPPDTLEILYDRIRQRGPIEAWSYTDIYDFAKEHYEKNSVVVVPASHLADSDTINQDAHWEYLIERMAQQPDVLRNASPRTFEALIAQVLEAFGFDVELTSRTRDGGRDLIATQSGPLAQVKYLIECKYLAPGRKLGVRSVRELMGVVHEEGATGGVIATTGYFSRDAKNFLSRQRWLLHGRDLDDIVAWLERYDNLRRGKQEDIL